MDRTKPEVDEIFCTAVELASAGDRAAYLDQACGADLETRRRVERLLHAQSQAGSFLAARSSATVARTDLSAESAGTIIGPYKLLQQIGEGGMGVVWMAEQMQPVQRKVALKVIRPGMDGSQVIARFEAERQALAMMDHVSIARVFDGGTTENGRPYFVMELVQGVPITKYCDDNHLTPLERLELFVPVCQAIQHAHQKGIIHRDIKPSNVMVTLYDGKPVPKVIDFGVAKATEQKLTERTLFTTYGTMVGTLEYMSPEQAEMSALGVDTRSDIYSLGVLLYELLTGSTPLTHKRMKEVAYAEILRMIKEVEPPKPSTRLSDSGEALASISAQRHMEPAKLTKLVRGELDWIVMKTLEKDRNRRYETANDLAADVQRYLSDEAVHACPPSAWYRVRKFGRRNKVALVLIASVAGALFVGTVVSTWQAIRAGEAEELAENRLVAERKAHREADEAHKAALVNFGRAGDAVKRMLTRVAQEELVDIPWMEPVRKALLKDALEFYEQLLTERPTDPETRLATAQARLEFAWTSKRWGETPQRETGLQGALDLLEPLVAEFPENPKYRAGLAKALHLLSHQTAWKPKRWHEAEQLLRRAVQLQESVVSATPDSAENAYDLANMLHLLGNALRTGGRLQEAEAVYQRVISIGERITAKDADDPAHLRAQICGLTSIADMTRRQDPKRAEALLLRAQNLAGRFQAARRTTGFLFDTAAVTVANVDQILGWLYLETGRPKEAQAAFRRAVTVYAKHAADFPSSKFYRERVTWTTESLARSLDVTDREEAERRYREAIEMYEKLVADFRKEANYRSGLARAHRELAALLDATGRPADAEMALRQALAHFLKAIEVYDAHGAFDATVEHHMPDDIEYRMGAARVSRQLAMRAQRPKDAEQLYGQALTLLRHVVGERPDVAGYRSTLGDTYSRLGTLFLNAGKLEEAEAACRQRLTVFDKLGRDFPKQPEHRLQLSDAHRDLGKVVDASNGPAAAELEFRKALEVADQAAADFPDNAKVWEAMGHQARYLGWQLRRLKRPAESEKAYAKGARALETAQALPGASAPILRYFAADSFRMQADAIIAQNRHEEAEAPFRKAVEDFCMLPSEVLDKADRRQAVAGGINHYVGWLRSRNKPQEAVAVMQKAIDFYARLHTELPKETSFREELVDRHQKLAWFLATAANPKNRDAKRAVELAKKAVELAPTHGVCWNTLGAAHYRAGDWQDAVTALQRSMNLREGGDSLDSFILAMAHWRLGEEEEARKWFNQAVKWMEKKQPNNEELQRFRSEASALLRIEKKKD